MVLLLFIFNMSVITNSSFTHFFITDSYYFSLQFFEKFEYLLYNLLIPIYRISYNCIVITENFVLCNKCLWKIFRPEKVAISPLLIFFKFKFDSRLRLFVVEIKKLCKSLINRLENKRIVFPIKMGLSRCAASCCRRYNFENFNITWGNNSSLTITTPSYIVFMDFFFVYYLIDFWK